MDPITRVVYRLTWFDRDWNEVEGMGMQMTSLALLKHTVCDWATKRGLKCEGRGGVVLSVAEHPHLTIQIEQEVSFGKEERS